MRASWRTRVAQSMRSLQRLLEGGVHDGKGRWRARRGIKEGAGMVLMEDEGGGDGVG